MDYFEKITSNSLFFKLKNVIENNPWHDNESVYDHLIKTHKIALEKISGDFIENPEAKKLFIEFVNKDLGGAKRKDLLLITALIHDIGKGLFENYTDDKGNTNFPGHENKDYDIAPQLLKDIGLAKENIELIARVVGLHGIYGDDLFQNNEAVEDLIKEIKLRSEELYREFIFNFYCDVFTAKPSKNSIKKITEIFNQVSFYSI